MKRRIHREWMTASAVILMLAAGSGRVMAQGSLTPPGAPAPTMKTLDQTEPRTPISSLPFSINQPGSYYLTTNLTGVSGSAGIVINSDDVTLDLNGFTLQGVTGSLEGIVVSGTRRNITIRNGVVRNWGRHGVDAYNAQNSSLENLKAYTNGWESSGQDGLRIGLNGRVSGCQALGNQDDGIQSSDGCIITDSTAFQNGGRGIVAGFGCTISDSAARNNGSVGILTGSGSTISDCAASLNDNDGIYAGAGSTIHGCAAYFNSDDGICAGAGSTVSRCSASWNTGDGILASDDCHLFGNQCDANGNGGDGAGIHVTGWDNRIEGNNVTDNDWGIDVDASGNIIIRNTASGNTTNYDIATGNHYGQIISSPGSGFTNANPWANFSF